MPNHLNPVRRIEAKRILTHLFAHERFDADHFVEILAGIMVDTPEVVKAAARQLLAWNNTGDGPRFIIKDENTTPDDIAEVVLDAAAIFRGETTAEDADVCAVPHEDASLAGAGLTLAQRICETLKGSRDCFLRAASGSVSRGAFEAQAAACNRALADLQRLVGNAPPQEADKEV
jgi:hypothetical protein